MRMDKIKQTVNFSTEFGTSSRLSYIGTPLSTPKHSYRPYVYDRNVDVGTPNSVSSIRKTLGDEHRYTDKIGQFVYFVVSGLTTDSFRDIARKRDIRPGIGLNYHRCVRENIHIATNRSIALPQDTVPVLKLEPVSYTQANGPRKIQTTVATRSNNSIPDNVCIELRPSKDKKCKTNTVTTLVKEHKRTELCKSNIIELPKIYNRTNRRYIGRTPSKILPHRVKNKDERKRKPSNVTLPVLKGKGIVHDTKQELVKSAGLLGSRQATKMSENTDTREQLKPNRSTFKDDSSTVRQRSSLSSNHRKKAIEMKIAKVDIVSDVFNELLKTAINHYEQYPTLAKQKQFSDLMEKIKVINSRQDKTPNSVDQDDKANTHVSAGNIVCHSIPCSAGQYHDNEQYGSKTAVLERTGNRDKDVAAFYKKLSEVLENRYRNMDSTPLHQTCYRMMLPVM